MLTPEEMKARRAPCEFQSRPYFPIDPRPDGDDLWDRYFRLVLRHHVGAETEVRWIDEPNVVYGWVIGLAPR